MLAPYPPSPKTQSPPAVEVAPKREGVGVWPIVPTTLGDQLRLTAKEGLSELAVIEAKQC